MRWCLILSLWCGPVVICTSLKWHLPCRILCNSRSLVKHAICLCDKLLIINYFLNYILNFVSNVFHVERIFVSVVLFELNDFFFLLHLLGICIFNLTFTINSAQLFWQVNLEIVINHVLRNSNSLIIFIVRLWSSKIIVLWFWGLKILTKYPAWFPCNVFVIDKNIFSSRQCDDVG